MIKFVDFKLAKKLKEKGYPQVKENTLAMYDENGEWFSLALTLDKDEYSFEDFDDRDCVCPTVAQVLTWLREEHKLHICADLDVDKNWFYSIEGIDHNFEYVDEFEYHSYEEASVSGISYALNTLIKRKGCNMKVQDLIELINNSEDLYCLEDAEDIIPKDINCVASELDVDKHRWFSTAVDVYACEDGYVGVYGVNTIYSEHMAPRDCNYPCGALEYEPVQITSYKPKTSV
jgi:hypothetical protein